MAEPRLTTKIGDVRDKLAHFKSEDYAKWGKEDTNPLAEAVRICYVAHVQLLLGVIDGLIENSATIPMPMRSDEL